jgi:hypothetical protein
VPGPGPSLRAKANPRLHTRGVPGPGSSSLSTPCPTLFFALALGLCTRANSYQEKWGQAPLRSTLLYRPRSRSGRSRQELKENKSRGL